MLSGMIINNYSHLCDGPQAVGGAAVYALLVVAGDANRDGDWDSTDFRHYLRGLLSNDGALSFAEAAAGAALSLAALAASYASFGVSLYVAAWVCALAGVEATVKEIVDAGKKDQKRK